MKIALLTTIWGRQKISGPVLEHYGSMSPDGVQLMRHAVCSKEEDAEWVRKSGDWTVHYHPNEPLNEKHTFGVEALRSYDFDAVCIVNSDDLITPEYFSLACFLFEQEGIEMLRILTYVMMEVNTGRCSYVPEAYPGSGIVLSREVVERLDWRPWKGTAINRMLDSRMMENIDEIEVEAKSLLPSPTSAVQLCALKSENNIWKYDEHIEACGGESKELMGGKYMNHHFPEVANSIHLPDYAHEPDKSWKR